MSQTGGKTLDLLKEDLKSNNDNQYTKDTTALRCSPQQPLDRTSIQEFEETSVLMRVKPTAGLVPGKAK